MVSFCKVIIFKVSKAFIRFLFIYTYLKVDGLKPIYLRHCKNSHALSTSQCLVNEIERSMFLLTSPYLLQLFVKCCFLFSHKKIQSEIENINDQQFEPTKSFLTCHCLIQKLKSISFKLETRLSFQFKIDRF